MGEPSPPPAEKFTEPALTEAQSASLDNIKGHLNYFTSLRPDLDSCFDKTTNVKRLRELFDTGKITSKRGKKIVQQFRDAFNYNVPATPKRAETKSAGKTKQLPKSRLAQIIQRLKEAEVRQTA